MRREGKVGMGRVEGRSVPDDGCDQVRKCFAEKKILLGEHGGLIVRCWPVARHRRLRGQAMMMVVGGVGRGC